MDTILSWWHKYVYSPPKKINVISIKEDSLITPATTKHTTEPKTQMIPQYSSRFVSTGPGRGYYVPQTNYVFRTEYVQKSEYVPASTTYFVNVKYSGDPGVGDLQEPKNLGLICGSSSRQNTLIEFFKNNKEVNVRYFLGLPIIPDIKYNFWLECPYTLAPIILVPTLIMGYAISKLI